MVAPRLDMHEIPKSLESTAREKPSNRRKCNVEDCNTKTGRQYLSPDRRKRINSIHCDEHTCRARENKFSNFCTQARGPESKFCHLHGGCTAPGCTKFAPREGDATWPYVCPTHRDSTFSRHPPSAYIRVLQTDDRPRDGAYIRVLQKDDRPREGPIGVHERHPGDSSGAEICTSTSSKHTRSGESGNSEGAKDTNEHTFVASSMNVHPRTLEPGAKSGSLNSDQSSKSRQQTGQTNFGQFVYERTEGKSSSASKATMYSVESWQIIRATCSYSAESIKELSFECDELFFATARNVHSDWYDAYIGLESSETGLVPKSSFEVLLSGICGRGIVPWDELELYYAMIYGDFSHAHQLLRDNPGLANDNRQQLTPIQFAAGMPQRSTEFLLLLIMNGADTNSAQETGETALTIALENGRYDSAITLTAFGAGSWDPEWRSWDQTDCSHPISREQVNKTLTEWTHRSTLQLKCDDGAIPSFIHYGRFDFSHMLRWGLMESNHIVVEYILQLIDFWPREYNASFLNALHDDGQTSLHYAVDTNQAETVKRLIDRGAGIDVVTRDEEWNSLQLAAANGRQISVRALLDCGANIYAKTPAGKTAIELARDGRHHECVSILVRYHSQISKCYDLVEDVLPRGVATNHDGGILSDSISVRPKDTEMKIANPEPETKSQDTVTMTSDSKREAELQTESPRSADRVEKVTMAEDTSTYDSAADGSFDGITFSLPAKG